MAQGLYGLLTVVALVLALVFATGAAVYVKRLGTELLLRSAMKLASPERSP